MAADFSVEWTRDLGDGRLLVMERDGAGCRASLAGFRGAGSTQEAALDDLLVRMRGYIDASTDFERALAPGGELDVKLEQLRQLVDQCSTEATTMCPHCRAAEPSIWDGVLFHFAHPASDKLKICHYPWRLRCLRCSADLGVCSCPTVAEATR